MAGSLANPYRMSLPERVSIIHGQGPFEFRRVTRLRLVTIVPDHVAGFARLFAPALGVMVAVNVPSFSILRTHFPSSV